MAKRRKSYLDDYYRLLTKYGVDVADRVMSIPPVEPGQRERDVNAFASAVRQLLGRMDAAVERSARDGRSPRQAAANAIRIANAGREPATAESRERVQSRLVAVYADARIAGAPALLRPLLSTTEREGRTQLRLAGAGRAAFARLGARYSTMLGKVADNERRIAAGERKAARGFEARAQAAERRAASARTETARYNAALRAERWAERAAESRAQAAAASRSAASYRGAASRQSKAGR